MTIKLKFTASVIALGFVLAGAYGLVGPAHKTSALHGAAIVQTGSWTGAGAQLGNSIPAGVTDAPSFKAWIYSLIWPPGCLCGNNAYGTPQSWYNAQGAAFLVETMLHGQINYTANDALVQGARDDYNTWAAIVDQYGRVLLGPGSLLQQQLQ
jgi:hypothetical protein